MMLCYKQMSVFLFLLPFPTSTPLFMMLFTVAMITKLRPCMYCVVLVSCRQNQALDLGMLLSYALHSGFFQMGITWFAVCKQSFSHGSFPPPQPALSTYFTSFVSPPAQTNPSLLDPFTRSGFKFTNPVANRSGDLNGGKLLWLVLDGYQLIDKRRDQRKEERRLMKEARRKKAPGSERVEEKREEEREIESGSTGGFEGGSTPTIEQPPQEEQAVASFDTSTSIISDPAITATEQAIPSSQATPKSKPWFYLWSRDTTTGHPESQPPTPAHTDLCSFTSRSAGAERRSKHINRPDIRRQHE